jgi:hypothetical protein
VLGRLAIEAPQQAELLLRLAAAGKERMAAAAKEAASKPQPDEKYEYTMTLRRGSEVLSAQQIVKPEAADSSTKETASSSEAGGADLAATAERAAVGAGQQHEREVYALQELATLLRPEGETTIQPNKEDSRSERVIETDVITSKDNDLHVAEVYEQHNNAEPVTVTVVTESAVDDAKPDAIDGGYKIDEAEVPFQARENDRLNAKTDFDEQPSELFEQDIIKVYKQLSALLDEARLSEEAIPEQVEVNSLAGSEADLQTENTTFSDFEAFVVAQPAIETPVTFELLQEQSKEQPLETTLIKLANYLSEDSEAPKNGELLKVMEEVQELLPSCYDANNSRAEVKITPEMTEKLLALLSLLGYEQPKEELTEFVQKHGFVFLFRAMDFMGNLTFDDMRREFLVSSVLTSANDHGRGRLYLAKAIFELIHKLTFEPAAQN